MSPRPLLFGTRLNGAELKQFAGVSSELDRLSFLNMRLKNILARFQRHVMRTIRSYRGLHFITRYQAAAAKGLRNRFMYLTTLAKDISLQIERSIDIHDKLIKAINGLNVEKYILEEDIESDEVEHLQSGGITRPISNLEQLVEASDISEEITHTPGHIKYVTFICSAFVRHYLYHKIIKLRKLQSIVNEFVENNMVSSPTIASTMDHVYSAIQNVHKHFSADVIAGKAAADTSLFMHNNVTSNQTLGYWNEFRSNNYKGFHQLNSGLYLHSQIQIIRHLTASIRQNLIRLRLSLKSTKMGWKQLGLVLLGILVNLRESCRFYLNEDCTSQI